MAKTVIDFVPHLDKAHDGRHAFAMSVLKRRLREARETAGLSGRRASVDMGLAPNTVSKWENEKMTAAPSPEQLATAADLYGVSVDWLLGRDGAAAATNAGPPEDAPETLETGGPCGGPSRPWC